jgi:hypothetical protein
MSQINFKKLFGISFTAFIIMVVLLLLLVSISQKASIATTIILVIVPLAVTFTSSFIFRIGRWAQIHIPILK